MTALRKDRQLPFADKGKGGSEVKSPTQGHTGSYKKQV